MSVFDDETLELTPADVERWRAQNEDIQLIDVREDYEFQAGHLSGVRHIELERLASQAPTIDRERPVVFYCRLGARSAMAAQAFHASGFDARTMTGGIARWVAEGRSIEPADGYVADH